MDWGQRRSAPGTRKLGQKFWHYLRRTETVSHMGFVAQRPTMRSNCRLARAEAVAASLWEVRRACAWHVAAGRLEIVAKIPAGPSYGDLRFNPCWDDLRGDKRFDKIVAAAKAASR